MFTIRYGLEHKKEVLNISDPSRVAVSRIIVQPGARFPWHTHPGPVLVAVAAGQLTYVDSTDCVERVYPAGTSFIDPGHGTVHTAFGWGESEAVVIAAFFGSPEAGPLTIPVTDPG